MSAVAGSKWSAVGRLLLCARMSLTSFAVGFTWTTEAGLYFYVLQHRLLFYALQHRLLFLFWVEVVTAAAVTIIPYLKEQQVGQSSPAPCHAHAATPVHTFVLSNLVPHHTFVLSNLERAFS